MSRRRFLGRVEKAVLALVGGFVFMGIATTAAPGLQTMVAGVACPGGTTGSAVVRYPHVVEPPDMVRNTPLVCLADGQVELASHAKVLPALFVVGLVASAAVIIGASLLAGMARVGRASQVPERHRGAMERIRFLPLLISTPFVFSSAYGLYWWLAVDTPYRVESCRGSRGGAATCYDGEPMYRTLGLGFTALAAVGLAIWLTAVVRSARRNQQFRRVWTTGRRAPATLISAKSTNTKVNGASLQRFTYEIRPEDGSPPFRFVEQGTWHDAGPVGTAVPAMYDPGDPGVAFLLPPGSVEPDPSPALR